MGWQSSPGIGGSCSGMGRGIGEGSGTKDIRDMGTYPEGPTGAAVGAGSRSLDGRPLGSLGPWVRQREPLSCQKCETSYHKSPEFVEE